ncbi:TPA: site-specific integrase [Clostridioides difficile]|uniref:tyrosine-type recombinase/integrase n=1 Tax=Clostridioides difficile TaxID=1496 RepID=UPI000945CD45|nr:tyrosine-type recombinase/integrase [Clostridioides difficile]MCW0772797.1 tyrosine-type recombinase/integrase [Clostridioides difficile]HBE8719205.1 site-specific integrase [Clostridioides difficile]
MKKSVIINLSSRNNEYKDPKIRLAFQKLFNFKPLDLSKYFDSSQKLINAIPLNTKCENINWKWFKNLYELCTLDSDKEIFCHIFKTLITNACYECGEFNELVSDLKHNKNFTNIKWLFDNKLNPFNLIVIKAKEISKDRTNEFTYVFFKADVNNIFLYNLLKEFIYSSYMMSRTNREFFLHFQKSLNNKEINSVLDFDINTFKNQFEYYKLLNKKSYLSLLKSFYLMILNTPEGKNILTFKDGIDYNMLQSPSFIKNYEQGYRLIYLNPLDNVPIEDKWLLIPNGIEAKSTKLNSFQYKPIDFSSIKDIHFKSILKIWFWNSSVSLLSRIDFLNILFKFIDFIFNLTTLENGTSCNIKDNKPYFNGEKVYFYISYVKSNNLNHNYLYVVKNFLVYVHENNLAFLDLEVLSCFNANIEQTQNNAKDIDNEDLLKIESKFKKNSEISHINFLYYLIFHISISSELRISQIINLDVNCIEKGANNQYYLVSNTKVTNGKKIKVPITQHTKRFLDVAINVTSALRKECLNTSINNHIFIHNFYSNKFKVISTRSFNDYLKSICKELNIYEYTSSNLRDTYITKAMEYAIKNNLSYLEMMAITWHKNWNTTSNHYVNTELKKYLESLYKVAIDGIAIKGTTKKEKDSELKQTDLVNGNCGYCRKDKCILPNELDCLMCGGFVATVDRIPYFEQQISSLEDNILSTTTSHDKEHLTTIKSLYVRYLAELYSLIDNSK